MRRALRRLWQRHVSGRADAHRAYVSFPTDRAGPTSRFGGSGASVGDVHDLIEELERVFEGRLDVYARSSSLAVVTDAVPRETFDDGAFEAALERIEDAYAETHSIARLEKWCRVDGRLVETYVVVPVKPLFSRASVEDGRVETAAD